MNSPEVIGVVSTPNIVRLWSGLQRLWKEGGHHPILWFASDAGRGFAAAVESGIGLEVNWRRFIP